MDNSITLPTTYFSRERINERKRGRMKKGERRKKTEKRRKKKEERKKKKEERRKKKEEERRKKKEERRKKKEERRSFIPPQSTPQVSPQASRPVIKFVF